MGGVGAGTRGLGEAVCVSPGAGLRVEVPWQLRRSEGPPRGGVGATVPAGAGGGGRLPPAPRWVLQGEGGLEAISPGKSLPPWLQLAAALRMCVWLSL